MRHPKVNYGFYICWALFNKKKAARTGCRDNIMQWFIVNTVIHTGFVTIFSLDDPFNYIKSG